MKSLLLFLLAFQPSSYTNLSLSMYPVDPTVDISSIRYIYCEDKDGPYAGSGFLIAPHVLATAYHVASGARCWDVMTKTALMMYKADKPHDFALMTGPGLPTDLPYVKYSCQRFVTNKPYLSWGVTSYLQDVPIQRMNVIYATKEYTKPGDTLDDGTLIGRMRKFSGAIAPGMSGGPVTDEQGYAHAVNNAGSSSSTILYELTDTILCKH